jgi:hypothetical protein
MLIFDFDELPSTVGREEVQSNVHSLSSYGEGSYSTNVRIGHKNHPDAYILRIRIW